MFAGTRARQYTPTWWMLSMAWKGGHETGNCDLWDVLLEEKHGETSVHFLSLTHTRCVCAQSNINL